MFAPHDSKQMDLGLIVIGGTLASAIEPCVSGGIWIQFPPLALSQRAREAYAMSHCPQALCSVASRVHGNSCKASHCNLLYSKYQTKSWPEVGAMSLSHTCAVLL